jgi:hypothetical protein
VRVSSSRCIHVPALLPGPSGAGTEWRRRPSCSTHASRMNVCPQGQPTCFCSAQYQERLQGTTGKRAGGHRASMLTRSGKGTGTANTCVPVHERCTGRWQPKHAAQTRLTLGQAAADRPLTCMLARTQISFFEKGAKAPNSVALRPGPPPKPLSN